MRKAAATWAGSKSLLECWSTTTEPAWLLGLAIQVASTDEEKQKVLSALSGVLRSDATVRQSVPMLAALDAADAFLATPTGLGYIALKKANTGVNKAVSSTMPTVEGGPSGDPLVRATGQAVRTFVQALLEEATHDDAQIFGLLNIVSDLLLSAVRMRENCTREAAGATLTAALRAKLTFLESAL
jgi:hypothetical protein